MSRNGAEPPSRASSMRPPPEPPSRFPLMTPSASPPVQRPFTRHSSTPSPAKKRRVSRAPSVPAPSLRSFSVASASSSSVSPAFNFDAPVDPGEELDAARRASSFRVLNVWSQLAEKYARRLDEDDIVDIGKGTIIKDCGVLRSSEDMFEIGYFAEEREKAECLGNDEPLTPADDEPDEIDAFADVQDNVSRSETDGDDEDGFGLAQHTQRLPPVREMDPADAADLAEFLRAEQLRRETFGDPDGDDGEYGSEEGEEDELTEGNALEESDAAEDATEYETHTSGDEEVIYEESIQGSDDEKPDQLGYSRFSTPSGSPEIDTLDISKEFNNDELAEPVTEVALTSPSEAESDDELGGWDCDEGSTLYSVTDFIEEAADEEKNGEQELASISITPEPPSRLRKKSRGKTQNSVPSDKSTTICRPFKSPIKKGIAAPSRSPSVTQLQTPPRSASFGPEARNIKITSTYSRKRRGSSSSSKRAPMRIQSTTSEGSSSETENTSPSKNRKQSLSAPLNTSPTKKAKLVPEVYIDVLPRTPSKKTPKVKPAAESSDLDSSPKAGQPITREQTAKLKGKAKATDIEHFASHHSNRETTPLSQPEEPEIPTSSYSRESKGSMRAGPSKKVPSVGSLSTKRRRGHSPASEELNETSAVDVIMNSPTLSPIRSSSRRVSSSRRSIVRDVESYDESVPDPNTRSSSSRRARSRPSAEHAPEVSSHSHPLPELNNFSFTPPHLSHIGYHNYPGSHYPSPLTHQHPAPLPNLQDPNAQYHLAQALQSLSILMGGALPFPPSPVHATHASHQSPPFSQNGHHQPWPPYTPRQQNRYMTFDTPQSVATEPPPSSPLGSDYSDGVPSSPTKRPIRERGRPQVQSSSSTKNRPKSAIHESRTRSRSRSRSSLRVSFSSPEATQIEDNAYVYASDNVIEIGSSEGEDSDFERRRLRREEHTSRSLQLQSPRRHVRAQTPGPPDHARRAESTEGGTGLRSSSRGDLGQPQTRHSARPAATSHRPNRQNHR